MALAFAHAVMIDFKSTNPTHTERKHSNASAIVVNQAVLSLIMLDRQNFLTTQTTMRIGA
jgi:hypothetical protein